MDKQEFIKMIGDAARKYYPEYKILPSLTIAQAIIESNWGKSTLSAKYFNYFGMKWNTKCGTSYVELPTKEWEEGKYIDIIAKFRSYPDTSTGIKGYYDFLQMKRYQNLKGVTDPVKACTLIAEDGWASGPKYTKTLLETIAAYDLTKWDDMSNEAIIPPTVQPIGELIYKVKKGDTLWGIAREYLGFGTKWKVIYNYNHLTSTVIRTGQILRIPR